MELTCQLTCRYCLQVAHLAQHFKGSAASGPGVPIGQRSFLGGLLPESLLHVLTSYGAGAFAAALCGDADTPELVWTHRMRAQRLIPQVRLQVRQLRRLRLVSVNLTQQYSCVVPRRAQRMLERSPYAGVHAFGVALGDVCDIA